MSAQAVIFLDDAAEGVGLAGAALASDKDGAGAIGGQGDGLTALAIGGQRNHEDHPPAASHSVPSAAMTKEQKAVKPSR